jgi:hypothetical protein
MAKGSIKPSASKYLPVLRLCRVVPCRKKGEFRPIVFIVRPAVHDKAVHFSRGVKPSPLISK